MRRVRRQHLVIGLLLALGCAGLKPTAEMAQYEQERGTQEGQEIELRFPELAGNAEQWHAKARTAQEDKEEEDMAYYGRIASLWWESASLRHEAQGLVAQREQLAKDTAQVEKELAEAQKRLKLAKATYDRMQQIIALEGKVAESAEVATARQHIADALEALNAAQAVDADVHASATFAAAEGKLEAASSALGKNKPKDAMSLAIEAKASAEAAKKEADPKFKSTAVDQAKLNRQKALFDALAVVGGANRAMVEGGVMITIVEAFSVTGTTIEPAQLASFDKIADIAKEYGDFSLVIEGHTDNKGGKKGKNLQLSESRAQTVLSHLASKGVSPSRMRSVGKGSAEPVADNKTKEGRAKNRRIQILFVAGQ